MNKSGLSASRIAFLLPILALSGCSLLQNFGSSPQGASRQAGVPLQRRPVEEPIPRNYFVLNSPGQSVVGAPQIVLTGDEDTLSDLAREYGLGYDELVAANPDLDPWLPGVATPVLLPTQYIIPDVPRSGIVLNIASKRLFYFPEVAEGQPQVVQTYPIGIGRVGWETPLGDTTVVSKAVDPAWYVPASVRREHAEMGDPLPAVVPAGPDNPLGTRVLKLGLPGYLIHGTNKPYGVGMRVSHGCVRLYPENIELLYSLVDVGVSVTIIDEPFLLGTLDGELYFESHVPLEEDPVDPEVRIENVFASYERTTGKTIGRRDRDQIGTIVSISNGVAVRLSKHDVDEVYARAKLVRNTFEPDPDAPTLSEVHDMIDATLQEDALPDVLPDGEQTEEQSL